MREETLDPQVERELAALDAALAGEPVDPDLTGLAELAVAAREARSEPSASFAASGEWALLRLLDMHRPKSVSATDPLDPNRVLLEFAVPVASTQPGKTATSSARLYLAFNFTGKDAKTQAPLVLTLPASFPRSAPQ